jgi:hypothetical protein
MTRRPKRIEHTKHRLTTEQRDRLNRWLKSRLHSGRNGILGFTLPDVLSAIQNDKSLDFAVSYNHIRYLVSGYRSYAFRYNRGLIHIPSSSPVPPPSKPSTHSPLALLTSLPSTIEELQKNHQSLQATLNDVLSRLVELDHQLSHLYQALGEPLK